jgi:uncharacterized protein
MECCLRLFSISLAALLVVSGSGCAMLGSYSPTASLERKGVFRPDRYPAGEWQPTQVLVQDAWFAADDGTKLHGWYVRHAKPRGHALLLHGNGGNVTLLADTLRLLNRRHELAVLALDYRGYGRSEGTPTEAGLYQDARAARAWLAEKEGIAERDVLLMGISLGGAVAVDLAASDDCRGLILASTFTSLPAVAQEGWPWLPMNLILTTRFDSLSKIGNYYGPVLISHGDADEVVPYDHGEALFEAARGPKRFVTNRGGKHNDPQPEEYRTALDDFLNQLPPLGQPAIEAAAIDVTAQAAPP